MAAELSCKLGLIEKGVVDRTKRIVEIAGLPTTLVNKYSQDELGHDEYTRRLKYLSCTHSLDQSLLILLASLLIH